MRFHCRRPEWCIDSRKQLARCGGASTRPVANPEIELAALLWREQKAHARCAQYSMQSRCAEGYQSCWYGLTCQGSSYPQCIVLAQCLVVRERGAISDGGSLWYSWVGYRPYITSSRSYPSLESRVTQPLIGRGPHSSLRGSPTGPTLPDHQTLNIHGLPHRA